MPAQAMLVKEREMATASASMGPPRVNKVEPAIEGANALQLGEQRLPVERPHPRARPRPKLAQVGRARILGVALVCLALTLAYVGQQARLAALQGDLHRLEQQLARARQEYEHLRLAVATQAAPAKVEELARQRLGLVDARQVELLSLEPTSKVPSEQLASASRYELASVR